MSEHHIGHRYHSFVPLKGFSTITLLWVILTPLVLHFQIPKQNFSLKQADPGKCWCLCPLLIKKYCFPQEWNKVTSAGSIISPWERGKDKLEEGASLVLLTGFLLYLRVQWHHGCWCYCTCLSWLSYGKVPALEQPGKVIQAGQRKPAYVWTPHLLIVHLLLQLPKIWNSVI